MMYYIYYFVNIITTLFYGLFYIIVTPNYLNTLEKKAKGGPMTITFSPSTDGGDVDNSQDEEQDGQRDAEDQLQAPGGFGAGA